MPLTLQSPQAHVHAAPRQSQATSALRSVPAGLPFPDSPYKGNRTAGGLSQLPSLTDHDVFQAHSCQSVCHGSLYVAEHHYPSVWTYHIRFTHSLVHWWKLDCLIFLLEDKTQEW